MAMPIIVLPTASKSLGSSQYAILIALLAIGNAMGVIFTGVGAVARRNISQCLVHQNTSEEARICWGIASVSGLILIVGSIVTILIVYYANYSTSLVFISILPLFGAALNVADNIRAGYNQHYITAGLQSLLLCLTIGSVLIVGLSDSIILVAICLTMPYILASVLSMGILLRQRPYLRRIPKRMHLSRLSEEAAVATASDGFVTLATNSLVFVLPIIGAPTFAAWFGTLVRLFGSLISPIILIALPLSTFVGSKWQVLPEEKQIKIVYISTISSFLYAFMGLLIIIFGGYFYMNAYFNFQSPPTLLVHSLICSIFFGMAAFKGYSLFSLSIESSYVLAFGPICSVVLSASCAVLMYIFYGVEYAVILLCILIGLMLGIAILIDARHHILRLRAKRQR